jgi:hypothetical protein
MVEGLLSIEQHQTFNRGREDLGSLMTCAERW